MTLAFAGFSKAEKCKRPISCPDEWFRSSSSETGIGGHSVHRFGQRVEPSAGQGVAFQKVSHSVGESCGDNDAPLDGEMTAQGPGVENPQVVPH